MTKNVHSFISFIFLIHVVFPTTFLLTPLSTSEVSCLRLQWWVLSVKLNWWLFSCRAKRKSFPSSLTAKRRRSRCCSASSPPSRTSRRFTRTRTWIWREPRKSSATWENSFRKNTGVHSSHPIFVPALVIIFEKKIIGTMYWLVYRWLNLIGPDWADIYLK